MIINKACLAALLLCSANNMIAQTAKNVPGPHVIVYKTKGNYRHLVPVLLSADKTTILSYPDPRDLKIHGAFALPTALHKGYWIDNRGGIGENVAFLKMTYEVYGKLKEPPTKYDMYKMIVDKDPLTFYCDCGRRAAFKDKVKELNSLIDKKKLTQKCKTIK